MDEGSVEKKTYEPVYMWEEDMGKVGMEGTVEGLFQGEWKKGERQGKKCQKLSL
jgi:hypothetical protein